MEVPERRWPHRLRGECQLFEPDPDRAGVGNEVVFSRISLRAAIPLLEAEMRDIEPSLEAIAKLRRDGAFVHCITNSVAQYFTANVLLACNAAPTMTYSREEAHLMTARADALLVNLGTLDPERRRAIDTCILSAGEKGIPVVLDPVKCELSAVRLAFAQKILSANDVILKVNRAEAEALADSRAQCRITTGAADMVESGSNPPVIIRNGTPMLARTIATGCALGGLVAALAAVAGSAETAAVAALVWFGVSAEIAGGKAEGPGSFPALLIDALASVPERELAARAMAE
jgi:hydroxyethylthiazole kinase